MTRQSTRNKSARRASKASQAKAVEAILGGFYCYHCGAHLTPSTCRIGNMLLPDGVSYGKRYACENHDLSCDEREDELRTKLGVKYRKFNKESRVYEDQLV